MGLESHAGITKRKPKGQKAGEERRGRGETDWIRKGMQVKERKIERPRRGVD
jgi:hypothetical protein